MRPHRRQPTKLPHPWDSPGKNTGVGCHFLFQCMKMKSESEVAQSCPTRRDPMECSPPGSSIHRFSILEFWYGLPLPSLCISFYFTAKWISCMYTYISSFLDSLPIRSQQSIVELPELYNKGLLVTYYIHNIYSVYRSIPISQFIPFPLYPLGVHTMSASLPTAPGTLPIHSLYVCVGACSDTSVMSDILRSNGQ